MSEIIEVINLTTDKTPINESWIGLVVRDKEKIKLSAKILEWDIRRAQNAENRIRASSLYKTRSKMAGVDARLNKPTFKELKILKDSKIENKPSE